MPRSAALCALAFLAGACTGGDPAPAPQAVTVSFEVPGGIALEGDLQGEGDRGVVLAHMFGSDRTAWEPLIPSLLAEGYLVLAFDFRGFGASGGQPDPEAAPEDLLAAIGAIEAEGAAEVAVVGASFGGTATLVAASAPEVQLAAAITLSAPSSFEGLEAPPGVVEAVDEPKLLIAAESDAPAADAAQGFYNDAPPPKRVEILPGGEHGTALLESTQAGIVRSLITSFLGQHL